MHAQALTRAGTQYVIRSIRLLLFLVADGLFLQFVLTISTYSKQIGIAHTQGWTPISFRVVNVVANKIGVFFANTLNISMQNRPIWWCNRKRLFNCNSDLIAPEHRLMHAKFPQEPTFFVGKSNSRYTRESERLPFKHVVKSGRLLSPLLWLRWRMITDRVTSEVHRFVLMCNSQFCIEVDWLVL